MKKLLIVSLFLASINLIYAENENVDNNKLSLERSYQNTGNTAAQTVQKRSGFWDFYEKQQAKLLKEKDKELFDNLSTKTRSQDDFYKYVNENWDEKTQIPSTKPAWGSFYELNEKNQDFLRNLIKELKNKKTSLTADEKKVLTLYDSYSDMKKRNEEGLSPIQKDLEKINGIQNIEDLKKYNVEVTKYGSSEFYGWGIGTDLNNSKNNAVYLGSAGILRKIGQYWRNIQNMSVTC